MAIEGQDTIKQVSRDSESPRYVLDGHITKVHKLKSGEDLKGNDANAAEDQARLVTQKLLQEAVEIQKPTPLGSAIQTVLPSEASITGFFHKNHKFYVEVGNEKRPSISIDDTDAGSALVLRIQGADSYKKFGVQGSRELGNKMLGLGGLLYGMGNEAQKQWIQNPIGAVLEGATNAALGYGLVAFEATAPHITSLASAALLGTVIGHFLGPEQRANFAKLGRNYHQLSTADGMLAMDLVKQVATNPLNKDFYHLAYGLAAGAAAIKPGVGMRAEMPSHVLEQRAFQLSMKFLAASPKLAVGALKELPTMIQQLPTLMQNMLNNPFAGLQPAAVGGGPLFMVKGESFKNSDSSYAMSQLSDGTRGKGSSGAGSGDNGLSGKRDFESELTGNTPFDEGRYMESEYTPDEQLAIKLGYPKDTPREEIYRDLEEERWEYEEEYEEVLEEAQDDFHRDDDNYWAEKEQARARELEAARAEKARATEEQDNFNNVIKGAKEAICNNLDLHPDLSRVNGWLADARGGTKIREKLEMMAQASKLLRPIQNLSKDIQAAYHSIESELVTRCSADLLKTWDVGR